MRESGTRSGSESSKSICEIASDPFGPKAALSLSFEKHIRAFRFSASSLLNIHLPWPYRTYYLFIHFLRAPSASLKVPLG
jgi:hypothetical protein